MNPALIVSVGESVPNAQPASLARLLGGLTERSDALLDELNLSDPILHELRESDADLFVGEFEPLPTRALQRETADTSEYVCRTCDEQACVCWTYADVEGVA